MEMEKNELDKHIVPTGFTVGFDGAVPILTLQRDDGTALTLRFQHPNCEATQVGLCLVAYGLLAKSDPNAYEFLYALSTDLRDLIQTAKEELPQLKPPILEIP